MLAAVVPQVRRYGVGFFAGVAIDPEMIVFGGNAQFKQIFGKDIIFTPALEFGFGELTTMMALHFDVFFDVPGTNPQSRWKP